jgi:chromosomal replication initiation ATPase DnaA
MHKQYAIALEHAPSYAPEDFLSDASLEATMRYLADFSKWSDPVLLLVGPKGCGKTHMLHALAARCTLRFLRVSSPIEQLFESGYLHIIEDADRHSQPALVAQAINHARAQHHALILTARVSPQAMHAPLPDLQSRLHAAQHMLYPDTEDALFDAVMAKCFSDLQWRVAPEVIRYLTARLPRSFAAHHAFIAYADAIGRQQNRALTMPFARELLLAFDHEGTRGR